MTRPGPRLAKRIHESLTDDERAMLRWWRERKAGEMEQQPLFAESGS